MRLCCERMPGTASPGTLYVVSTPIGNLGDITARAAEVLRTADAVSPVLTGTQVLLSLVMFALLYALLFSLFLFLLNGKIQEGPAELEPADRPDSLPDTFREVFRHHPRASASGEPQYPVAAGTGQRTTQDA